jgi:GNAT superfamily N-acetyltransferase
MPIPAWHEEPIAKHHNRNGFNCGEPELNEFLHKYARQSHERGGWKTYVAIDDADGKTIHGYYSLSPASVQDTPAYRLSRLAVNVSLQGKGLGTQLLLAAGRRCLRVASEAGGTVMVIDAKNDRVAAWYAMLGAMPLLDNPRILLLPLATIHEALAPAGKL